MIEFHTQLPDKRLRPYIKMYFGSRNANPPKSQRIVPNGEMGLWFFRNNGVGYDGEGRICSCVSGQTTCYHDILSLGGIDVVGAHFTVIGAARFFNHIKDFYGRFIELQDFNDAALSEIEERVMLAEDYDAYWRLLDAFFLRRLVGAKTDELNIRRIQSAANYAQSHLSGLRISDLASEACLSQRQFYRLFTDVAGLPPKEYVRIRRYHKTLYDLKCNDGSRSMTEVAWLNGYYDFSHLTSDFRKIAGYSPKQLLSVSENVNDAVGWRI